MRPSEQDCGVQGKQAGAVLGPYCVLVELHHFLGHAIAADGDLLANLPGKVRGDADHAMLCAAVHTRIVGLELVPKRLELVHGVGSIRKLGENRADSHDDGEVIHHVASELGAVDVVVNMISLHHHASDTPIVIDAAGEHLLVDGLILATDVITVKIDIEVVEAVARRERHIGVDVVHVERVGGHLEVGGAQGFGAVGRA